MSWILIDNFIPIFSDRGAFGDKFGAVNALFSGLAFAGVIYAILLQRKELELQRYELTMTRNELEGQKQQFEAQNNIFQEQTWVSFSGNGFCGFIIKSSGFLFPLSLPAIWI